MWSVPEHTRKTTGEYWSDIKPRRGRVTENKILSRRAAKVTKYDQNLKENVVTLIVFKLWCTNQPSVRWCRARRTFPSDRDDSIRTKGSNKLQHIVWLRLKRLFCHVSVNRWELLLLVSLLHTCLMKQTCKVLFCFDSARKSLLFYISKSEGSYYSTLCSLSKLPRKPKYNLK